MKVPPRGPGPGVWIRINLGELNKSTLFKQHIKEERTLLYNMATKFAHLSNMCVIATNYPGVIGQDDVLLMDVIIALESLSNKLGKFKLCKEWIEYHPFISCVKKLIPDIVVDGYINVDEDNIKIQEMEEVLISNVAISVSREEEKKLLNCVVYSNNHSLSETVSFIRDVYTDGGEINKEALLRALALYIEGAIN